MKNRFFTGFSYFTLLRPKFFTPHNRFSYCTRAFVLVKTGATFFEKTGFRPVDDGAHLLPTPLLATYSASFVILPLSH